MNSTDNSNRHGPSITRRAALSTMGGVAAAGAATSLVKPAKAADITINVLMTNIAWCEAVIGSIAEAYKAHTNGRVQVVGEMLPYDLTYEKLVLELSAGSKSFDVVTSDVFWCRQIIRAGWVRGLEEMKEQDPSLPGLNWGDYLDNQYIYNTVNGKRHGIVVAQCLPCFVFRKDLLAEAGHDMPTNWDQFRDAAKAMTKGQMAGAAMLLGGQDACMGDWIARVMGESEAKFAGDDLCFDQDGNPTFNEGGRGERGIERMMEVLDYCPEGVWNFDYADGVAVMDEGRAAMTISWLDMWPGIEVGPNAGKFGYNCSPTANIIQHTVGGWSLYVNSAIDTEQQREAYKFLAWMLEGPAFQMIREQGEVSLLYKPDMNDPAVKAEMPFLAIYDCIEEHNGSFIPLFPYNANNPNEIQRIMYEEVLAGVAGDKSPKKAMEAAYDRCARAIQWADAQDWIMPPTTDAKGRRGPVMDIGLTEDANALLPGNPKS